jgi:hypothetical protein
MRRRPVRVVATFMRKVCLAALRAIITSFVFTASAMVMMYFLGVPVPSPSELRDKFEDLGRLARILS